MTPHTELTTRFLQLAEQLPFQALDALPEVYVFAKDRDQRFVYYNHAFVLLWGMKHPHALIGLSDADLSPAYLVDHYREDDLRVLGGETIKDRVELVRNMDGVHDWFITTKLPVRQAGHQQTVIGLLGITRPLVRREDLRSQVLPLEPAITIMSERYGDRLTVSELAKASAMSARVFSERFRQHFGTTPNRYLRRIRLLAASELLSTTDLAVSVIASRVGYYDQSHFTNDFRRFLRMSPRDYRLRYKVGSAHVLGSKTIGGPPLLSG